MAEKVLCDWFEVWNAMASMAAGMNQSQLQLIYLPSKIVRDII